MPGNRFIQSIATKYLFLTIVVTIIVVVGIMVGLFLMFPTQVDNVTKIVDAAFKAVAVVVGAAWALNRYYVQRTDNPQIRVSADVQTVSSESTAGQPITGVLLIYNLDILNTGKTLLDSYMLVIHVDGVRLTANNLTHVLLSRWPETGLHSGRPIEPGSWAAINDAILIPADVKSVRIRLDLYTRSPELGGWDWHQTFSLAKERASADAA